MATFGARFVVMAQVLVEHTYSKPDGSRRGNAERQRLFQQFFDRRGCNPCCTAVDVPVSYSDVQQISRATLGSTVKTCTASASGGCWKIFHFFYVMVYSGPEVDSRPALLLVSVYAEC